MSGLMTARFLLHLRKWEAKHSAVVTASTSDASSDIDVLEFTSNPAQRGTQSYLTNDFGEDPVHRAEQQTCQHRGHDRRRPSDMMLEHLEDA